MSSALRPPTQGARGARKAVVSIAVLVCPPKQKAIQAISTFGWRIAVKEKFSEETRHGNVNGVEMMQRQVESVAPHFKLDDCCQVHFGGGVRDCETHQIPSARNLVALEAGEPAECVSRDFVFARALKLGVDDARLTPCGKLSSTTNATAGPFSHEGRRADDPHRR